MDPIISKYKKKANLELEMEIYGLRCSKMFFYTDHSIGRELGCVCFFHLMLNRTFFELNAE